MHADTHGGHGCERSAECQFQCDGSLVLSWFHLPLCSSIMHSLCIVRVCVCVWVQVHLCWSAVVSETNSRMVWRLLAEHEGGSNWAMAVLRDWGFESSKVCPAVSDLSVLFPSLDDWAGRDWAIYEEAVQRKVKSFSAAADALCSLCPPLRLAFLLAMLQNNNTIHKKCKQEEEISWISRLLYPKMKQGYMLHMLHASLEELPSATETFHLKHVLKLWFCFFGCVAQIGGP